jgi:hypothetical protein
MATGVKKGTVARVLEKHGHGFMDNWITGHGIVWITTHRSPPPGFNLTKENWELMWSDVDHRIRGCGIYCILLPLAAGPAAPAFSIVFA